MKSTTFDSILAYLRSPQGQADEAARLAREARCPAIKVTVPEGLVGLFSAEFEHLAAKSSPWIKDDCGKATEAALVATLVKGREAALRLTADECRALYEEKHQLHRVRPMPTADIDRAHEIRVLTDGHPISITLDIAMLMLDPRLDTCGYPLADWLPAYVEGKLDQWRAEGYSYGCPWVDAAL